MFKCNVIFLKHLTGDVSVRSVVRVECKPRQRALGARRTLSKSGDSSALHFYDLLRLSSVEDARTGPGRSCDWCAQRHRRALGAPASLFGYILIYIYMYIYT